jgi:translation initiation factor IF-3
MLSGSLRRGGVPRAAWLAPRRGLAGLDTALLPQRGLPALAALQQQRRALAGARGGGGAGRPHQSAPRGGGHQRARQQQPRPAQPRPAQPRPAVPPREQQSKVAAKKTGSVLPPVDEGISVPGGMVRLIDHLGVNRGIVPLEQGLAEAKKHRLNLVQVSDIPGESAKDHLPVCKVMDMSKYVYELKKKEAAKKEVARARERAAQFKELKFGTSIGDHDLEHKLKQGREFLEKNYSLRAVFAFRRSMAIKPAERQDKAFELLTKASEFFASCGRELPEQRKILPSQVRAVFVPGKGSPHSPTHPKAHASAAALAKAAEQGDLHATAAVSAEAAARAKHVTEAAAPAPPAGAGAPPKAAAAAPPKSPTPPAEGAPNKTRGVE